MSELGSRDFAALRELIVERSGILLADDASHFVERRLKEHVGHLKFANFSDYVRMLQSQDASSPEMLALYDLLTNKETYFFREEYQLKAFREEVLPALVKDGGNRQCITVWSAGCSTGEEPYSIAILLIEAGLLEHGSPKVYGTDISRQCVATARRGIFGEVSFRTTSADRRKRFFVEREDGIRVHPIVTKLCHFGHLNLLDVCEKPKFGLLDAIFCRNVLIYFEPAARQRVLRGLYERLRPGGYLMLGHSESLLHETTPFEAVHLRNDVVYRRPLASIPPPPRSEGPRSRRRSP